MIFNYRYLAVFSVVLGMILWIYANYHGLGLTHDSYYYLDLAKPGIWSINPQHFYSSLIALLPFTVTINAFLLNGCLYLGTIVLWILIIEKRFELTTPLEVAIIPLLCWSVPVFLISSFLWTEMLFVFILSVGLFALFEWCETRKLFWLLFLVCSLPVAIWARKAGLIFSLALLLSFGTIPLEKKSLRWLAVFLLLGISILVWHFYLPVEKPRFDLIVSNVEINSLAIVNWFVPVRSPGLIKMLVGLGLIFILFLPHKAKSNFHWSLEVFFLAYFMIRSLVERLDAAEADRYFSILVLPFVYYAYSKLSYHLSDKKRARTTVSILVVGFALLSLARTTNQAIQWNEARQQTQEITLDL